MKKLLATLLLLTLAVPVAALEDDGTDSFGIYFDPDGDTWILDGIAPNTMVDAYFIIAGPSAPSIGGWEVFVDWAGLIPLDVEYYGISTLDLFVDLDKFVVGIGYPLSGGEFVRLARVTLLCPDDQFHLINAGPAIPASIEGVPAYVDGGTLDLVPLTFSTVAGPQDLTPEGWTIDGMAAVNGEGPIATESQSWSGVKALFE